MKIIQINQFRRTDDTDDDDTQNSSVKIHTLISIERNRPRSRRSNEREKDELKILHENS